MANPVSTLISVQAHVKGVIVSDGPTLLCLDSQDPYAAVFAQFPNFFHPCAIEQPCQHTETHVHTNGPQVSARLHCLPLDRLQAANNKFAHMLNLWIIRPSFSCWSSPLHVVPKKLPGDWRPCGYYRTLNLHSATGPHHFM